MAEKEEITETLSLELSRHTTELKRLSSGGDSSARKILFRKKECTYDSDKSSVKLETAE